MGRTSDARDRILASSGELMHERGYTSVGVSEVCSKAGVQKGSFYHFFPSKVELAHEVIDGFAARTRDLLTDLVEAEGPPLERIVAYTERLRESQAETRKQCGKMLGCPIGNLALEMSTQEPELRDHLKRVFDDVAGHLASMVQQAVDRGDLPDQDAQKAGQSLVAYFEGAIMLAKMHDDPEMLQGLSGKALRLLGAESAGAN